MSRVYDRPAASSAGPGRTVESRAERRCADLRRYKAFAPATLSVGNFQCRAHVLNVSVAGAKLHVTIATRFGTPINISVAGISLIGRVQWARENSIGVLFDGPISTGAIDAIVIGQ